MTQIRFEGLRSPALSALSRSPAALELSTGSVARWDHAATGDEARAATGYAIGGIPPFAHDEELRVVMDARLLRHDTVWAAAGLPDAVFAIAPAQLAIAARAHIAEIAEISDTLPG